MQRRLSFVRVQEAAQQPQTSRHQLHTGVAHPIRKGFAPVRSTVRV
ncbi:MAG: hypothetical protein KME13_10850 [Myxacorys californica WJT36-NPBG1]|nr:hypothetical protein [Myxacorys californica WJT36-NPBG1]